MPHIHEKIDFTAETFIVHKNKVLLRKHDKLKIWMSVGGHIELDEDPVEAALREVKEEVGLDVTLYQKNKLIEHNDGTLEILLPEHILRNRINETHEHITLVYYAKSKTNQLKLSLSEKTEECKWFTTEEIDNPKFGIKQNIKSYAKEALKLFKEKE